MIDRTATARAGRAGRVRRAGGVLRPPAGLAAVAVVAAFLVTGCASLLAPKNLRTDVAELRPGNYTLDPDHAFLLFRVEHLGLSQVIGRFDAAEATLDFTPDDLAALRLDGVVETASLDFGNEDFERRIRGGEWLDVETWPEARFTTTSVVPGEDGALTVNGDFTLRGTTLPIVLDARFNGGADNILTGLYTLGFEATGTLSRSAYGIDGLGALVGDEIGIEIHAEFQQVND